MNFIVSVVSVEEVHFFLGLLHSLVTTVLGRFGLQKISKCLLFIVTAPYVYMALLSCSYNTFSIPQLQGVISPFFLFSIWLDLPTVSPTVNTYIQSVLHLLLFLFTDMVAADHELCPRINKPILKASINKQTVQRDFYF